MRVIYRSASRYRLNFSFHTWLEETGRKGVSFCIDFYGRGRLIKFLINSLAWIVFSLCLPLEVLLFILTWVYTVTNVRIVKWLESEAKIVESQGLGNNSFNVTTLHECYSESDFATLLVTAEGRAPGFVTLRQRMKFLLESAKRNFPGECDKLKMTLTNRLGCQVWKEDYDFNVDNHITLCSSGRGRNPLNEDSLKHWVNEISSQKLGSQHPPWKVAVTNYFDTTLSRVHPCHAFMVRIHYLLVPFFTLSDLLVCPSPELRYELKKAVAALISSQNEKRLIEKTTSQFEELLNCLKVFSKDIICSLGLLFDAPRILYSEMIGSFQFMMRRQSKSSRLSNRVFWYSEFQGDLLKKIKEASGASKNVILMCALAGALRQYYRHTGEKVPEKLFSVFPSFKKENALVSSQNIPVSFRKLSLPIDQVDPLLRLGKMKHKMSLFQKDSNRTKLYEGFMRYIYPFLPPLISRVAVDLISQKYHVVVDQIPVSESTGTLWEKNVTNVLYWRPLPSTNIGLAISLVYYSQKVSLAFAAQQKIVDRPELIVNLFHRELNDLALALGVRIERKRTPPPSPTTSRQNGGF